MKDNEAPTLKEVVTAMAAAAIPNLSTTVLVAGYDPKDGSLRALNLGTLHEAQVLAEKAHALDRLDSRNAQKQVTIPAGSAVATVHPGTLEVPAGEVWYISRLTLVTPAGVTGNIRISSFPKKTDGTDKEYLATDQAASTTTNYDLAGAGELGAELRLVGGDKITVRGTVTTAPVADVNITLTAIGRKGKRLV